MIAVQSHSLPSSTRRAGVVRLNKLTGLGGRHLVDAGLALWRWRSRSSPAPPQKDCYAGEMALSPHKDASACNRWP